MNLKVQYFKNLQTIVTKHALTINGTYIMNVNDSKFHMHQQNLKCKKYNCRTQQESDVFDIKSSYHLKRDDENVEC